jgi:hypothetical protein
MSADLEHRYSREKIGHIERCLSEELIDASVSHLDLLIDEFLAIVREHWWSTDHCSHTSRHSAHIEVLFQDISTTPYALCLTTRDKHIGPFAGCAVDISWYCEDISTMFESELGGDECARRESCLGYEDATRERGNQLISLGEVIWIWSCTEREVRYECSSSLDDIFE